MLEYFKGAKGSWIWLVIRLYLGYNWIEASWHKITGATPFNAAAFIKGGIANATIAKPTVQPWWGSFLKNFALPNVGLFNFLVQYGELLTGIAMVLGFAMVFTCTMGMIMNFSFMMTGSVSTSPVYMLLQFALIGFGGAYAGYMGVDYWFRPWFRSKLPALFGQPAASARQAA